MTSFCWRKMILLVLALTVCCSGILASQQQAKAAQNQELQVFAASVMTEAFTELKAIFEKSHPNVKVNISFAATSELRAQVEYGATPDVFESADFKNINTLWRKGMIPGKYQPIAHNRLVVIIPNQNQVRTDSLSDLTRPGLTLVGCAPEVPVGAYTQQVLSKLEKSGKFGRDYKAKVQANFRSLEPNVKGIVAKVMLGDADAGFCYASDVNSNITDKIKVIPIPEQYNVLASHYIGLVKGSHNPSLGKQFIALTLSPQGQAVFTRHGLIPLKALRPSLKSK